MAEKKEYVKLWLSYRSYFEPYSAAEVGRLVLAMMEYRASGVEPEFSGSERFVWPAIRRDIDKDTQEENSNQFGRHSQEAKHWRKSVFERDKYTCQICGAFGRKLNAHHIKPWALYKEFRFDVDNGVTLCEKCHKSLHRGITI